MSSKAIPYTNDELFAPGAPRSFAGAALREVAFPLGGIGTGTVSLGGRGQLRDWEIFNRPGKGRDLPYTFFAIWAQAGGVEPVARVLEAQLQPPFGGSSGPPTGRVPGLPRLSSARFTGEYPFAVIDFADEVLPVQVQLEAFNPFIPLDADASGLPVAIFRWRLHNPGSSPVEATVALSLLNAIGYDGQAQLNNRRHALFGANRNEFVTEGEFRGLRMTGEKCAGEAPQAGSMALLTNWPEVTYSVHWERAGWWDDLQNFWDDFRTDGRLPDDPASDATRDGETDVGTLGLRVRLAPGETAQLPFVVGWHLPNLVNYWNREEAVRGKRLGNYYTAQFPDAWSAARHALANLPELEARSRCYVETLRESTLPECVLDAVSSQASIIRTTTCLRTEDGRFHAFEGCNDNAGCCPMNCTHVWNYEQTLAHLFPDLERSMRLTDFTANMREKGDMAFRTLLPLIGEQWGFQPAADGQMGCVMKLYREWQLSGDLEFVRALWPEARRSVEFAWCNGWDPDRDGVMEGSQHNTYDIEFFGPNTMMGSLYLGALLAAARMAEAVGDPVGADFRAIYAKGRERLDRELWNGEFYRQRTPGDVDEHRYQYGEGCLSDQLLGQWFAHVAGLGYVLPAEHVRSAMAAVFRHNWRQALPDHHNCQRVYALNDEAGLLLCSWPNGGRPRYPFPYADEVWTGIEYQVAAHLIYEGLLAEGLAIVKGVRDRHDGERRNPWDEFECGHHYARAMASWSLLLALSGYGYSAPEQSIRFAPRLTVEDFRVFFSTGTAWGLFRRQLSPGQQTQALEVRAGSFTLRRWSVALPAEGGAATLKALSVRERTVAAQARVEEQSLVIEIAAPLTLAAGETLTAEVVWSS